ncbi:NAD(P)(+) transhydrogenase (Re/Si-specific) subunit beta [Pseudofulvimonas gallinarii]|uniref:NAD(P) transhydrogenase subunit beta n=1 Tax=Pseudofulvimonas gallinarii TaxID=634155 RepID=A0A4R3L346_9GAMM|nr:NAD(P)(+) transhydrogenase (Re/Si-specific) subunit beta [Pseudofulvimonas gallinarii]TCS93030.1 NAD(P) transhydrogenase subunit beta [Pseudofulvimonas gallinarii]THD11427.1 NAD(P) transhydrogenase subunit beta [Pseudofulvimonas gallinarii]
MSTIQAWLPTLIKACYFLAAFLFIYGLKRMGSPRTARRGIVQAGIGMVVATLATFLMPDMHNYVLILLAIALGGGVAWWTGQRVAMTDMPQMVALYNGMGGGSAAAIGAVELYKVSGGTLVAGHVPVALAVLGGIIGTVAFSGSLVAFAKLQGWIDKRFLWPGQNLLNGLLFLAVVGLGAWLVYSPDQTLLIVFFALALLLGVLMTLPIGGADMPVVISLYNALTGLAVAFEGFVLGNEAMIIAGTVVGAAGTLLTQLMAKAMNRPLSNVLFTGISAASGGTEIAGEQKPVDAADAASLMAYAERVVIVPGYGMAVAQAQHKLWEFCQGLIARGVKVKFAIHPVAGRMPGHMNVLLAEAGVPYDLIEDMDDINPEFPNVDVALVIGANDVVNPVAKTDPSSPIYGMPILDVDQARNVIIIKRGKGRGFAGIENALFYADNARLLYGDGNAVAGQLVTELKQLDG